jgi:hypothetical protein
VRYYLLSLALCVTAGSCQPNTARPPFAPLPDAAGTEVRLSVREATRHLAEMLRADSVPIRRVALRDGYIESAWFRTTNRRPVRTRHPLGPDVVRIRAWADPARPGSTQLTVETLYRPMVDPSLPERELEREVARNHPVAVKMEAALRQLVERYGGAPAQRAEPPAAPADQGGDF